MDSQLLARNQSSSSVKGDRFYEVLKSVEAFPLGYFDPSRKDPSITKVIDEARSIMKQTRAITGRVLHNCMMRKGGKYTLFIPADKGYGAEGQKDQQGNEVIPPNSDLTFDVELVDFMSEPDFQRRIQVLQQAMQMQQGQGGGRVRG